MAAYPGVFNDPLIGTTSTGSRPQNTYESVPPNVQRDYDNMVSELRPSAKSTLQLLYSRLTQEGIPLSTQGQTTVTPETESNADIDNIITVLKVFVDTISDTCSINELDLSAVPEYTPIILMLIDFFKSLPSEIPGASGSGASGISGASASRALDSELDINELYQRTINERYGPQPTPKKDELLGGPNGAPVSNDSLLAVKPILLQAISTFETVLNLEKYKNNLAVVKKLTKSLTQNISDDKSQLAKLEVTREKYDTVCNLNINIMKDLPACKETIKPTVMELEKQITATVHQEEVLSNILTTKSKLLSTCLQAIENPDLVAEFTCPVCYDSTKALCAPSCGHVICQNCSDTILEHARSQWGGSGQACCPICRKNVSASTIVKLYF
jgi:hypothetical protein